MVQVVLQEHQVLQEQVELAEHQVLQEHQELVERQAQAVLQVLQD